MKENRSDDAVIGFPASTRRSHCNPFLHSSQDGRDWVLDRMNKLRTRADGFVNGVKDHGNEEIRGFESSVPVTSITIIKLIEIGNDAVSTGPKITETVKGKLSLGTRVLNSGGLEGVFRRTFTICEEEKLVKASQCYLSTTAGPIAGVLFVSTEKIAFRSERSIPVASSEGDLTKVPYKVLIPLSKVKGAFPSENVNKPGQKYIYIVTVDGFEFWFMGFVSYKKTLKHVQKAISER
ncbi:GEM-like protein 6 [Apostasia shenzhenica]|uniref:GEM-like protein 6 n=1 Tax=Apostasia shenzhenica TaxID=1088818 RepID=A0A2H9ZRF0_9ASPA|nr:GEM-like protein 6 [Apostasia shenzhenica]